MLRRRKMVSSFLVRAAISCFRIRIEPVVGVSRPPIRFIRVLFPEPEVPTMAINSPWLTVKVTPLRACTWFMPVPYTFSSCVTSKMFMAGSFLLLYIRSYNVQFTVRSLQPSYKNAGQFLRFCKNTVKQLPFPACDSTVR